MLLSLILASTASPAIDPYMLPIGRAGTVQVEPGTLVETASGNTATPDDVARAAIGKRFVYLGESHDVLRHHEIQAEVIRALAKQGRSVIVGFEMFTRPVQDRLNPWTLGWWTEQEFIEGSDWKTQWGFDFALYRPIFQAVRDLRLPMVALNVPRDWVRRVGRSGPSGLTAEEQAQVPPIDISNGAHRQVFDALMGGHPIPGTAGENIYAAQVLWDVAMADSALKYLDSYPRDSRTVFVVIAGSGHVMYGQGINYRIWKRTGESGVTLVMGETDGKREVSRGLGDFVCLTPAIRRGP